MNFSEITTIPFFKNHVFEYFSETGSTNDNIKSVFRNKDFIHSFQVTAYQSAGRGQHDRKWESERHQCLMFSFSADFSFNSFPLSLIGGLAIASFFIKQCNGIKNLWLKWPNDIWYKNGKLAGILTESTVINKNGRCVIGVGINIKPLQNISVNSSCVEDFAPHLTETDVLKGFCEEWDKIIKLTKEEHTQLWNEYAGVFWKNRFIIKKGEEIFEGKPLKLNFDGTLTVLDKNLNLHQLFAASLSPILPCSLDAS